MQGFGGTGSLVGDMGVSMSSILKSPFASSGTRIDSCTSVPQKSLARTDWLALVPMLFPPPSSSPCPSTLICPSTFTLALRSPILQI